jgi:hypothetical protein
VARAGGARVHVDRWRLAPSRALRRRRRADLAREDVRLVIARDLGARTRRSLARRRVGESARLPDCPSRSRRDGSRMARGQLRLLTTEVLRGGKCVGSSHGPPGAVMLGIGLGDRSRDDQRPAREPTRRQKRPFAGLCEALFRTRTETPSLPSRFSGNGSQPMATVLACFRRFRGLFICHRLPLVAPATLHTLRADP